MNTCGSAAKCVRTLKGLYEISGGFASLEDSEIKSLKVCNVHYNRDCQHHGQLSEPSLILQSRHVLYATK